jgi:hypothetical protein
VAHLVFCRKVKVIVVVVEAMTAILTCAALVKVCIDEDLCWLSQGPQATASR